MIAVIHNRNILSQFTFLRAQRIFLNILEDTLDKILIIKDISLPLVSKRKNLVLIGTRIKLKKICGLIIREKENYELEFL